MKVLMVEPGKSPYAAEIESGLKSLQAAVGGDIQAVYPYEDPVALICNEEGKLMGLPLNRALFDDDGHIYDIVSGNFLIVGLGEENFTDLSPDLMEKYGEQFKYPEKFARIAGEIIAVKQPATNEHREKTDDAPFRPGFVERKEPIMLMAVNEPYALMVQPDDILISPREVDEHFGTMVCFHPRYALGDHHNHMDKDDFLREMYLDTVGHDEAGMKRYERMVNIVSSRFRHGPKTEERAIDEAMQKVISEKYLMLPLYLYDHSGLAMSTESFSGRAPHAEWDSGQVGWIYVSKEDALKEFDADKMTGAIRQKADALMRSEVAAYDSYLRGECYGFELYKNGELSDSCWGFMGNFSDVLKDMAAYLPDECKGMVDHLEEQERPATIIKTLLKHAKIQVDQAAKAFEHASRQQVLGESR